MTTEMSSRAVDQEWGFLHATPVHIRAGPSEWRRHVHVDGLPVAMVQYFRGTVCDSTTAVEHVLVLAYYPRLDHSTCNGIRNTVQPQFPGATISFAVQVDHEPSHAIHLFAESPAGHLAFAAAVFLYSGTLDDINRADITIGSAVFRVNLAYEKGSHRGSVARINAGDDRSDS